MRRYAAALGSGSAIRLYCYWRRHFLLHQESVREGNLDVLMFACWRWPLRAQRWWSNFTWSQHRRQGLLRSFPAVMLRLRQWRMRPSR